MLKYFGSSYIVTVVGSIAGALLGYYYTGTTAGALSSVFIVLVLSILETSLSFDNAVVNAAILKDMTPLWRHRFLTWGMFIAVFLMRFIFPLIIVAVVAHLNPWQAFILASQKPDEYAAIMLSAHVSVSAFGGAFLMMVALKYFFDMEKHVHWIRLIEEPLARLGRVESVEIGLVMLTMLILSQFLPEKDVVTFLISGGWGLVTFVATDSLGEFLKLPDKSKSMDIHRASLGMFIYLEVLDASFSFDGVVGAFAITHNLFIIMIGLGVGAMFVRSLTIMLVDKGTLTEFRYLEHGAFYAVLALAVIMFVNTFAHVPEIATGLVGAAFIAMALWSSVLHNRTEKSR